MRKPLIILQIILLLSTLLFADTEIYDLKVNSSGNAVVLKWKSKNESNYKTYEIQRGQDQNNFIALKNIDAKGNNSEYSYIDNSVFKPASRTFYYRIKILGRDGSIIYSDIVSVSPKISSTKQTWGSIKALFQ